MEQILHGVTEIPTWLWVVGSVLWVASLWVAFFNQYKVRKLRRQLANERKVHFSRLLELHKEIEDAQRHHRTVCERLESKHAEYATEMHRDLHKLNDLHQEFKSKTDELLANKDEQIELNDEMINELEHTVYCQAEKIDTLTAQLKERTSESRKMALMKAHSNGSTDDVIAAAKKYHRFLMGKE